MWPRFGNIILGIGLMVAPAVLDVSQAASNNWRIAGPIAVMFATIAIFQATRGVRWANVAVGAWLIVSPLIFGFTMPAILISAGVGILMIPLAIAGGKTTKQFAGGWSALFE